MAKSKKNSSLQYDLRRVKIGCRYFMLVAAAALLFLWPNHGPAYAADILQIDQNTDTWYSDIFLSAYIFQSFTPATNFSLSKISICIPYFENPIGGNSNYLNLKNSDGDILTTSNSIFQTDFNANNVLPCNNWIGFNFASPYPLTASTGYFFEWAGNPLPGSGTHALGTSILPGGGDVYAGGCGGWGFPNCATGTNVFDALFKIYSAEQSSISITFPANASSTPDFEVWKADFKVIGSVPIYGSLKLNYGTSSSTLNQYDILNFIAYDNEEAPANIPKSKLLLPNTTYYAQANILNSSSTITATSTLIYFQTTSGLEFLENNYYTYPTSTIATSTPIQITCDPDDPWYAYSLCKLMVSLFVPNPETLNKFGTLADDLKTRAPIGYFYSFAQALGGFNTTSTPAFTLAGTASINDITGPLDVGLTAIIYLIFTIWVFNRIRKLEL